MKSIAIIALSSAGFLSIPAFAQDSTMDGTTDQPQAPSVAKMAPAGAIAIGGPWNEFSVVRAGSLARGCAPADPAVWDVFRAVVETLTSWGHRHGTLWPPVMG